MPPDKIDLNLDPPKNLEIDEGQLDIAKEELPKNLEIDEDQLENDNLPVFDPGYMVRKLNIEERTHFSFKAKMGFPEGWDKRVAGIKAGIPKPKRADPNFKFVLLKKANEVEKINMLEEVENFVQNVIDEKVGNS